MRSETSPAATSVNGLATVRHVIAISCDGLRGDTLAGILNTRPADFPNFIRLRDGGAATFRARTDYGFTETIPNHSGMLTGRPTYEPGTTTVAGIIGHGQENNTGTAITGSTSVIHKLGGNGEASTYKSSVFDVVHESGRTTVFLYSKARIYFFVRSYNGTYGADTAGQPGVMNGERDKIDRSSSSTNFPEDATATGEDLVDDADDYGLAAFTFLHFVDCDSSIHTTEITTSVPPASLTHYEKAVKGCDTGLGKLFGWLDSHPEEKSSTIIMLTADHGGIGGRSSHLDELKAENYTIPFFIYGPGFAGGTDLYLYCSNRTDPGQARLTDLLTELPNQPIRNADLANFTMQLMGLPPVPGSYFRPVLFSPGFNLLTAGHTGGQVQITWPEHVTAFDLESTASLTAGPWAAVTEGITQTEAGHVFTAPAASTGYFRLKRKPQQPPAP